MSEQVNTEGTNTEAKQAAPAFDADAIAKLTEEKARAAVAEALKNQKQVDPKALEQSIRKNIASQISGEGKEKEVNPIITKFANDPEGFVRTIVDISKEEIERSIVAERNFESEQRKAMTTALKDRPDISKNQAMKDLFVTMYAQTDEEKSEDERMKEAVTRLDLLLEEAGADKREERIKKATGVTASSGSGRKDSSESKGSQKSESELAREELEARKLHFRKTRNRHA